MAVGTRKGARKGAREGAREGMREGMSWRVVIIVNGIQIRIEPEIPLANGIK